jgi:hypothetical protein
LLFPKTATVITVAVATPPKKITELDSLHVKPYECGVRRELGEKKEPRSLPQKEPRVGWNQSVEEKE